MTNAPHINVKKSILNFQKVAGDGEFKLRAFPGERFRLCEQASYVDGNGNVILVVQRFMPGSDGVWKDFAKGSLYELLKEVV